MPLKRALCLLLTTLGPLSSSLEAQPGQGAVVVAGEPGGGTARYTDDDAAAIVEPTP